MFGKEMRTRIIFLRERNDEAETAIRRGKATTRKWRNHNDQPSHDISVTLNNSQINSHDGDSIVLSQNLDAELKVSEPNELVVKSKAQENDISNNREIIEVSENETGTVNKPIRIRKPHAKLRDYIV
ncbi:hypothetical protein HHI36_000704 [Cryptolaemus montrouzieri]|uniref:Uncharacterized protein n=1 Tax=Cryptolaemus montrouzieri TaxID=559131 RepID=A0ABD2P669_9CUCU